MPNTWKSAGTRSCPGSAPGAAEKTMRPLVAIAAVPGGRPRRTRHAFDSASILACSLAVSAKAVAKAASFRPAALARSSASVSVVLSPTSAIYSRHCLLSDNL